MNKKVTPKNINKLNDNEIFVFGSNLLGKHGLGAAKTALIFGAKYGKAKGLHGKTYAIPTKDENIKTLSLKEINFFIKEFIEFSKNHKYLIFLVTEIGCGLAGYKPKDIAPFFIEAKYIDNIHLPESFWNIILNL